MGFYPVFIDNIRFPRLLQTQPRESLESRPGPPRPVGAAGPCHKRVAPRASAWRVRRGEYDRLACCDLPGLPGGGEIRPRTTSRQGAKPPRGTHSTTDDAILHPPQRRAISTDRPCRSCRLGPPSGTNEIVSFGLFTERKQKHVPHQDIAILLNPRGRRPHRLTFWHHPPARIVWGGQWSIGWISTRGT